MKFGKKILFAQEGATMPAPEEAAAPAPAEGAPVEGGAPSPEEQLQGMGMQLADMLLQQIGDPQAALMVLQIAAEAIQQQAAPAEPQFRRKGGKIYFA